jgi:hypothetical protein
MSSPQSPPQHRQPPPESLGPATEDGAGGVIYGQPGVTAVITRQRDPAERERERAAAREHGRCSRCVNLPDDLVQAIGRALYDAEEKGRRLR